MANHLNSTWFEQAAEPEVINSDLCKSFEKIISNRLGQPARAGPFCRLAVWLNQVNLKFTLCNLQGFDLVSPVSLGGEIRQLTFGQKFRRYFKLSWAPKFYHLVSLVLICASVGTFLNLYYQYAYDANRAIHDKITRKLVGGSRFSFRVNNRNGSEFLDQIEAKVDEAYRWLKHYGSSHCEWSFAIQISYMQVWIPTLVLILVGPIYMKFHELAYFSWIRWLFDEAGERKHWAKLTAIEVNRFEKLMLMSSQIKFNLDKKVLLKLSNTRRMIGRRASLPLSIYDEYYVNLGRKFEQIMENELLVRSDLLQHRHAATKRQLRSIALDGQLSTLTRTRKSLGSMAATMLVLSASQGFCSICLVIWIYRQLESFFVRHGKHAEFFSLKDTLESCCLIYFSVLCNVVCITNKSYNLVTAIDQVKSVNRLDRLIRDTIVCNERLCRALLTGKRRLASTISTRSCVQWDSNQAAIFIPCLGTHSLVEPSDEDMADSLDQLELGLLRVVLEYRLFTAQYELAMRPTRFYGLFYFYTILSLALLIRIHAPYMYLELRVLGACLSYICMAPQYMFMLPLCHLHHRCMDLYKVLYSLVAQMAYYETKLNLRNCISLEMAISTLKRCLIRPEHVRAKFTCRVLFLDITYNTMLKVTFWISLLIIPMLNSKQSSDDLMSSIMSDPLGIFSFK